MDCGTRCVGGWIVEALPAVGKSACGGCRASTRIGFGFNKYHVSAFVNYQAATQIDRKWKWSISNQKQSRLIVKATNAESNKCESRYVGSPLEPRTQTGILLKSILKNQPQLFHVAVAKELEDLEAERNGAIARKEYSRGSPEACLHMRIADLKEGECEFAVEEIMYILIIHSFSKVKVPMAPRLAKFSLGRTVDIWPSKDHELESIHCPEILHLVKEHLFNIVGREGRHCENCSVNLPTAEIKRLQLGRLYAASIMYGYFLKSTSLRHRLEHSFAQTVADYPLGCTICVPHLDRQLSNLEENLVPIGRPFDAVSALSPGISRSGKPKKLREYVMDLDAKAVQLCASLKSQEAANLTENHCLAVFGDGNVDLIGKEDVVVITFSGLKRLVLEAVAFGTFLWDAERYVESMYTLKENQLGVRQ